MPTGIKYVMPPEPPRMPKPAPMTVSAKAFLRRNKKQAGKMPIDKALFEKYRDKQPTLENMHALIKEGLPKGASGTTATVHYFIWHLTKSPAERKFIKKVSRAYWQYRANAMQGFARALLESTARKQGKTKAEAKETLLQDLDKLIKKIDQNTAQMMSVAQNRDKESELVRHTGVLDIRNNIFNPLTTLRQAVEKL